MCVLFPCIPQIIGSVGRFLLVYNATNAFTWNTVRMEVDVILGVENRRPLLILFFNNNTKANWHSFGQKFVLHYIFKVGGRYLPIFA